MVVIERANPVEPLISALVISLLVHLALAALLAALVGSALRLYHEIRPPLSVTLAPPPARALALPTESGSRPQAAENLRTPHALPTRTTAVREGSRRSQPDSGTRGQAQTTPANRHPSIWVGRVDMAPYDALGRLPETLVLRSLAEFPVEVEAPVRVATTIDVAYPEASLQAHREGTVLAWIVVDENGQVEEISLPEGDEEFAEAVQAALLGAKFLAAEDLGHPVRHFTMLQFSFRIAPAQPVPEGSASARPAAQ
jgi:TonB family protein